MFDNFTESTRRALRTLLQGVAAFAAFLVAVAIPPVGDAITAVLRLFPGVNVEVTPGLVGSIGIVGAALIAVVTKIQNLMEGRDEYENATELAVDVMELAALIEALVEAAEEAGVELGDVFAEHGYVRVTD